MTIFKAFLLVLILFCLAFGCSQVQSENKYCENEIKLFSIDKQAKLLQLDRVKSDLEFVKDIEDIFSDSIYWKDVNFGLSIKDGLAIKVQLTLERPDRIIDCFVLYPEHNLTLNHRGEIQYDDEILESIDTLKHLINHSLPNNNLNGSKQISITWFNKAPIDSLEMTFENIVDGYLMKYESLSKMYFEKDICQLNLRELDSLIKVYPFYVDLKVGRKLFSEEPDLILDTLNIKN